MPPCGYCLKRTNKREKQAAERKSREEYLKKTEEEGRTELVRAATAAAEAIPWATVVEMNKDDCQRAAAEAFLHQLLGKESLLECIQFLLGANHEVVSLARQLADKEEQAKLPALELLAAMKDRLRISDADWELIIHCFHLAPGASLYRIKQYQKGINSSIPISPTPGGNGASIPFTFLLSKILQLRPLDESKEVIIKLAVDGMTVTSGKRKKLEVATFDVILDEQSIAELRSPNNANQFIIYFGPEDYNILKSEFGNEFGEINKLIQNPSLTVDGKTYQLKLLLVADMAAGQELLGMYDTAHPKSFYRCLWCGVTKDKFTDLDVVAWDFLSEKQIQEWEQSVEEAHHGKKKSDRSRAHFAHSHNGIRAERIIKIARAQVLPCNLHCQSGITMKLFIIVITRLKTITSGKEDLQEQIEQELDEVLDKVAGIKLVKNKKKGTHQPVWKRVRRSRLSRPQLVQLLVNHTKVIDVLALHTNDPDEMNWIKKTRKIWRGYLRLALIAAGEKPNISEVMWREKARSWGKKFLTIYPGEDITPYMHVFIYHYGYFIEKYGSIERFANFSIESLHQVKRGNVNSD